MFGDAEIRDGSGEGLMHRNRWRQAQADIRCAVPKGPQRGTFRTSVQSTGMLANGPKPDHLTPGLNI